MNCQRTILTVSAVLMLALMTAFPAWADTIPLSPTAPNVIKTAVEKAASGTTFTLSAGVYTEDPFFVPSGVNIYGADRRTVIIQESSSIAWQGGTAFIWVKGSNVNLAGFTAQGRGVKAMKLPDNVTTLPFDNSAKYGINMAGSLNTPVVNNTNVTLTNITSRYFAGTGVNINGANGMTLNKVESVYNGGAGVYLSDAHNITINNVTTNANSWGGVCVNVYGATFAAGTSGIVFSGANSFGESGSGSYGLWLESDAYPSHHQNGELITYSDKASDGAMVTIQASDFSYASDAIYYDFTGDNLTRRLFFASAADASAFLTPLNVALAPLGRSVNMVALSAGSTFAKSIFSSLPAATLETLTGPAGPTGATGSQGPSGLNGLPGAPGAAGPAGPAGASAAALDIRNKVAIQKGGDRLAALQVADGGFAWPLTGGSAQNIIGPTAMGLAQAYLQDSSPTQRLAVQNAGVFLLAKTNTFSLSDGYLAAQLDRILGGSTYRDFVKANFYDKLTAGSYMVNTFGTVTGPYDLAGFLAFRHNYRAGGQSNVAAWDIGIGVVSASAIGVNTAPWLAQLQTEINGLDATKDNDILGLAGAVYALATTGTTNFVPSAGEFAGAAGIKGLADRLAAFQVNGTTFSKVAVPQDIDLQTTAYAVLALNQADRYSYLGNILSAADFMSSVQLPTGGWEMGTGTGEYNEATGEVLWAITAADYSLQGPKGDVGAVGATGATGATGDTGPQGPIGATGAQGPIGPTGNTGLTGSQGPIGPTGNTGSQGPIGTTGNTGLTGSQGPIGPTGNTGPAGSPDTQAQILTKIATQADGAVLTMQQAVGELATNPKIRTKDSAGNVLSVLTADGKLGLGTAAPAVKLQVSTETGGTVMFAEGFGASSAAGPTISTRAARGTSLVPTAVQAGDMLGAINFRGYGTTGWAGTSRAAIFGYAEESYTDTAQGSNVTIETTAPGTTTRTIRLKVTGSGNVGIGTTTPSQALEVNGKVKATQFIGDASGLTNLPVGPIGPTGPQGPTGAIGSQGLVGPTGAVGATGAQGLIGPTGAVGATGAQGLIGPTGAVGATGAQGLIGPTGAVGATGAQGLIGPTGAVGATGAQGLIGPTGAVGATGAQGLLGPIGTQGPTGATGDTGATGAKGLTWKGAWDVATTYSKDDTAQFAGGSYIAQADVAAGLADPSTNTAWQLLVAKGDTGAAGATGATGATGDQGSIGPIGLTGATGGTGPQGPVGPTGAIGGTGSQGPVGPTGATGGTGSQGPIGPTGFTGQTGSQGPIGPTGPQGSPDTQAQILAKIATQANGAVLSMQQAVGELATNPKITTLDATGNVLSVLTADGKLGLGTASPVTKLQISNPTGGTAIFAEGFGTSGAAGPTISTRAARGTALVPAAVESGDVLGAVNFRGYGSTGWAGTSRAAIFGYAEETYTDTAQGSSLTFETTAPGTTARTARVMITGSGNVGIGTTAPTQALEVNGGVRMNTGATRPTCSASIRGTFWFTQGAGSANDSTAVCSQFGGAFTWKVLF